MQKPVAITQEIATEFGITWVDPFSTPDLPDKGLAGVCEWRPGIAEAKVGRTNLTIGHVNALPDAGAPRLAIKEWHPQDEVFSVFAELQMGLSHTKTASSDDVTWVLLGPGVYIIPKGLVHVPPVSPSGSIAPMIVLQGTKNTTQATDAVIAHPAA